MGAASSKRKDKKGKKRGKEDVNALRDIHNPPKISLPRPVPGLPVFTYWKSVPFLPQSFMTKEEWDRLQKDAAHYGVTTFQIYELFLRLCSPYDISYGTVQLRKFFREFDPRFRKVLRRLVVKLANGHSRILFEDIVRFIFEFCGMDFYNLIIKSVAAVREFDVMNTITVRALVRYINGDRDMDEFTRSVLAHLHANPPFHHVSAFVQLCVRYPVLVYPIILMQRSIQRRFFGLKFWREYMKRTGNQLFPPDFSKVDAEMITSRVILLECVSLSAIPFQFGTSKTATEPPKEFLEQEMRKWNKRKKRLLQNMNADGTIPNNEDIDDDDNDEDDEFNSLEEKERDKFLNDLGGSKRNIDLQHGEIDLYSIRNEQIAASAALASHAGEKIRIHGNDAHEVLGFLSLASPMVTKSLANRRISFTVVPNGDTSDNDNNTNNEEEQSMNHTGGGTLPPLMLEKEETKTIENNLDANPLFQFNLDTVMKDIALSTVNTSTGKQRRNSQLNAANDSTTVAIVSPVNRDDSTTTGRRTSVTTMAHGRDRRRASLIAALGNNSNSNTTDNTPIATFSPSNDITGIMHENGSNNNRPSSVRRTSIINDTSTLSPSSRPSSSAATATNNNRKMENYLHEKLYVQPLMEQQNRRISVPKSQTITGGFGLGVETAEERSQDSPYIGNRTVTPNNNNNNGIYSPGGNAAVTSPSTTTGRRASITSPGKVDTFPNTNTNVSSPTAATNSSAPPPPSSRNRRQSLLLPNNAAVKNAAFQASLEFEKLSAGMAGTSVDTMMNQRKAAILRQSITGDISATTLSPNANENTAGGGGQRRSSVVLPGSVESPISSGATNPIAARRRQSLVGTLGGNIISPSSSAPNGSSTPNVISPVVIVDATSPTATGNRVSSANVALTAASRARRASVMYSNGGGTDGNNNNWLSNLQSPPSSTPTTTEQPTAATTTSNDTTVNGTPKATKTVRIMDEPIVHNDNTLTNNNPSTLSNNERKEESLPTVKPVFDISDKLQQLQDKAEKPLSDNEKMRLVNNLANQTIDNLNEKSQVLVLQNFDSNSKNMFDQGYSAIDTRLRLAAFGFSNIMGNNNAEARKERIEMTSNKILPIPVPPKVSEYLLDHPHPAGTVCKLTSLQISKIALAHVNSGAGQLYGIVRVPCLLCNRTVLHVDDLIAEEAEEEIMEQQLAEEAEEEARRLQEEEDEENENDSYYGDDDDEEEEEDTGYRNNPYDTNNAAVAPQVPIEPEYQQEYENDADAAGEDRAEGRIIATIPPESLHPLHRKNGGLSKGTESSSLSVSSNSNSTHNNEDDSAASTVTSPSNVPTSASNTLGTTPNGEETTHVADEEGGYYMERDDTSDIDGYQRKEDPAQFVVDKKYRIGNRRKKGKGSDVVRERMAKFWAKEAEIKRRVTLIKRQQDKLAQEEAKIKAEKEANLGTINAVTVNSQILDNNQGIDDDLEDSVVKVITDKALHDPYAITLVTGSVLGSIAGTRKPNTDAPPSSLVADKRPSKLPKEKAERKGNEDEDEDDFSDASSSYYDIASVAHDSVAEAEQAALEHAERVAIARDRLAKEQLFAKATAKNTGLCGECDLYCRRVATHLFGYKIAYRLLETATVKPSVDDELNRHTQRARAENHPLVQGKPMDDEEILEMQRKMELMKQAALLSAQETNEDGSVSVEALAAQAQLANNATTWKRIERDIYEYPDDNYIELWDDDTKRFFYYNVTIGESQWHKPKKYLAYKDRETRKEEELIEQQAQKELMKLEMLSNKAAKTKVQTSLGQRQEKNSPTHK